MPNRLQNLGNWLHPGAPKGIIYSAREWAAKRKDFHTRRPYPSAWYKPQYENGEVIVPTERLMNAGDREFAELERIRWYVTEESGVLFVEDGRILGEEGTVISPDNRLFAEFTYSWTGKVLDHPGFRRRRIPRIITKKGWYGTILFPSNQGYYHWMLECLPRLHFLDPYRHLLDGLIVPSTMKDFHHESLACFGFDSSRWVRAEHTSHWRFKRLFIPLYSYATNPAPWMHVWFKQSVLGAERKTPSGKRIFVSREDACKRRVVNEKEVRERLATYGFESVRLSETSFFDQARMFYDADMIVAPHGAGLSNLVFCRSETKVLEILPHFWKPPCYAVIAASVGCEYWYLISRGEEEVNRGQEADFHVDVSEMDAALARMGVGAKRGSVKKLRDRTGDQDVRGR